MLKSKDMKIIAFSDIHSQYPIEVVKKIEQLRSADMILYAGDDIWRFSKFREKDYNEIFSKLHEYFPEIKADEVVALKIGNLYLIRVITPRDINSEDRIIEFIHERTQFSRAINEVLKKLVKEKEKDSNFLKKLVQEIKGICTQYHYNVETKEDRTYIQFELYSIETGLKVGKILSSIGYPRANLPYLQISEDISLERDNVEFSYAGEGEWIIQIYYSNTNLFKAIAEYSKKGVFIVPGNRDYAQLLSSSTKTAIKLPLTYILKKLVEDDEGKVKLLMHDITWISENLAIIGIGGTPEDFRNERILKQIREYINDCRNHGAILISTLKKDNIIINEPALYCHLREIYNELPKDTKIIILSHAPPFGVLDQGWRFEKRSIGLLSLRAFLEDAHERIPLIVCGHVHSRGGQAVKYEETVTVNVSSHEGKFDRGNIASITLEKDMRVKEIDWTTIPSVAESILTSNLTDDEKEMLLYEECRLSRNRYNNEAKAFIYMYKKYGDKFLDALPSLARMKFWYSFTWNNVLVLFELGVIKPEDITDEIYKKARMLVIPQFRQHLDRGYRKILSERSKRSYLLKPLPEVLMSDKIVVFDTEYYSTNGGSIPAIYGFLDMESKEIKQFLYGEEEKIRRWLGDRISTHIFVHWGGADKSIITRYISPSIRTFNLLFFVQNNFIVPIEDNGILSDSLISIYRRVYPEEKGKYMDVDGLFKAILSKKIIDGVAREKDIKFLLKCNKDDLEMLMKILLKLQELSSKS